MYGIATAAFLGLVVVYGFIRWLSIKDNGPKGPTIDPRNPTIDPKDPAIDEWLRRNSKHE